MKAFGELIKKENNTNLSMNKNHEKINKIDDHKHKENCGCGNHQTTEIINETHVHKHGVDCSCNIQHKADIKAIDKQKNVLNINNLDCANCAAKVERELNKLSDFDDVVISFMNKKIYFDTKMNISDAIKTLNTKIKTIEDGVFVSQEVEINEKKDYSKYKITISILLAIIAIIINEYTYLSYALFMSCYLVVGLEVLIRAFKNILKGKVFDENFLMTIATIGALFLGEIHEAAAVMIFYQVGEYFQKKAVESSRKSIAGLMDIKPLFANVKRNSQVIKVAPEIVRVGDILVIKAGEKVAVDGVVISGKTSMDSVALTGESMPYFVEEGFDIVSGMINLEGVIEVRVTKEYKDSTVSKILDLVENVSVNKASAENFITKFAKYYTPFVVFLAVIIAFVLPMVIPNALFSDYLYRALTFLVISCPCALVISVPLTYFAGIGGLSKHGILVKGGNYLDALNKVDTIVFDKTGTITKGNFIVSKIISDDEKMCLKYAAHLEANSNHPIAKSILSQYGNKLDLIVSDVQEISGRGLSGIIENDKYFVGNFAFMQDLGIKVKQYNEIGTLVYVIKNLEFVGVIVIKDQIKDEAIDTINQLKRLNIKTIMLTGDNEKVAFEVCESVKVDEYYSELLPQDKVKKIQELINNKHNVAFIGDGINDAPVIALSNVGFAMGHIGSDAAIEAADIVIMNDKLSNIILAIKGAKITRKIVIQNIVGALLVKFVVLLLGATGFATMWWAIFADVGVSLIAIINAIRALKVK